MVLSAAARTIGASLRWYSQAAALSTSQTNRPLSTPASLTDDIDRAEMGIPLHDPVVIHPTVYPQKGSSRKGKWFLTSKLEDGTVEGWTTEEAVTISENPDGEADIAVEGVFELQCVQNMRNRKRSSKEARVLNTIASPSTNSTANSTSKTATRLAEQKISTTKGNKKPVPDNGHSRILKHDYKEYPHGFPRLAAFQNSSSNLAIFRRFGNAHCRVLLQLEVEITQIIDKLNDLDNADDKGEMRYRLKGVQWHPGLDTTQKDLLEKLAAKLSAYDDLFLKDCQMRALRPPPLRHYMSLFNWIWSYKPLDKGQYDFIFDSDDFVASTANAGSVFDEIIETSLTQWPQSRLAKLFLRGRNQLRATVDEGVHVFSRSTVTFVAKLFSVSVAVTILLIPIFLLYLTQVGDQMMVLVVLMFVLAFATLMSSCTTANMESIFVGTCTYCAVLVTFLGNVQGKNTATENS